MSPPDSTNDEALKIQIAAQARWQIVFALLAFVLPFLPYVIFERQARRLDALADHGKPVDATVTRVARKEKGTSLTYSYSVEGGSFSWTVPSDQVPHAPGETFQATYLPEEPSFSRPDAARAESDAEETRAIERKAMLGVFVFFALNGVISEIKLRRLRKRALAAGSPEAATAGASLSTNRLGQFVALLILTLLLATNLNEDTARVQAAAFGAAPLGIPIALWTSVIEIALFAPYFLVIPHLMQIIVRARRDRAPLTRGGLVWYIAHVHLRHPDLARSQKIALGGFVYFIVIVACWIAYASYRHV